MTLQASTNVLKEVKAELDRRDRIGKLDSALLFLASSASLVFAALQVLLGGLQALVVVLPAFLLGWVAPFYVGYVQGAIRHNWAIDRVRGWIYLLVGLGDYAYAVVLIYGLLAFHGNTLATNLAIISPILVAPPLVLLTGLLRRNIFGLYGRQPNTVERHVTRLTGLAAIFLAVSLWNISSMLLAWHGFLPETWFVESGIGSLAFGFGFLLNEGRLWSLARHSYGVLTPVRGHTKSWATLGAWTGTVMIFGGSFLLLAAAALLARWLAIVAIALDATGASIMVFGFLEVHWVGELSNTKRSEVLAPTRDSGKRARRG